MRWARAFVENESGAPISDVVVHFGDSLASYAWVSNQAAAPGSRIAHMANGAMGLFVSDTPGIDDLVRETLSAAFTDEDGARWVIDLEGRAQHAAR